MHIYYLYFELIYIFHFQGPEWENPHPLPEMQVVPINPPPLPPKQMIDKYPLPPHIYRNIDVNNAFSMNQFPMK